jgi:formylglycine-generating enzyme required for sulfatase activity
MAIEHRLMHLETLAYQLPHLPLDSFVDARPHLPAAQPGPSAAGERAAWGRQQATIAAGVATLGRQPEGDFCWDNESPQLKLWVPGFAIDRSSVTNRQFRDFVVAGGYSDRSLWSAADWAWKDSRQLGQPLLWQQRPGGLWLRACFAELPLPLDWPALVSLAEARAYVAYRQHKDSQPSLRLMSEAEYHRAAYGRPADADDPAGEPDSAALPWGDGPAQPLVHGNFGCVRYDPTAVAAFPAGDSAWGVSDLVGNGWEWTQTPFAPLPGFRADPRYPGYSQDFFDQQHFVLKGASARTDGRFLRQSFRNWFQPHYPYVFAKFRCVATPAE